LLLEAARRLTPLSPTLASETYLEALSAAMIAGRMAAAGHKRTRRGAGREGCAEAAPLLRGPELLLDGLATFFSESYEAAVPILRRAQDAFDASSLPLNEQLRWKRFATISSVQPLG